MIPPEKIAKFSIYDGISWHTVSGSTPINGWTHLAGVFNNSTLILYVNGTIDGRLDSGPPDVFGSPANVTIGAYENTLRDHKISNYFSGPIVDSTVYTKAFAAHEVEEEFRNILEVYSQFVNGQTVNLTRIVLEESLLTSDTTGKPGDDVKEVDTTPTFSENIGLTDKLTLLVNNQTVQVVQPSVKRNSTILYENLGLADKITILLNNEPVNLAALSGTASNLTHSEIEVGKIVNWTQTVMINGTQAAPSILVEIPEDAQNIQVEMDDGTGNYTEITGVMEIIESEMDSADENNKMSFREIAKMLNAQKCSMQLMSFH
jgi:hypothetical protein